MAYNMGGRRFRPVGSGKKRTAPQYGPVGTGCPFVEEAVARLYRCLLYTSDAADE